MMDRRAACLDARLRGADTLIERWESGAIEAIERARGAVIGIAPLGGCDARTLLAGPAAPADPEVAARIDALRGELFRAHALHASGDLAGGEAKLAEVIAEATALDQPGLIAEAELIAGEFGSRVHDFTAEERGLRAALRAAELAQHDPVKVEACAKLVLMLGQLGRFDEGRHLAEYAGAALERIGGDDRLATLLDTAIGNALGREGRHAEAIVAYFRALDAARRAHHPVSVPVAILYEYLAGAFDADGRIHLSEVARAAALAIHTHLYGAIGADLSVLFDARRDQSFFAGDLTTTIELDTERLRLLTLHFPGELTQQAEIESQLGYDHMFARRALEGIEHHQRAIALRERAGDRWSPRIAVSLNEIGAELLEQKRPSEAVPYYQRAIEVAARNGKLAEDDLATARAGLGRAYLELDDPVSARPLLEEALAFRVVSPKVSDAQRGGNRFDLARAIVDVDPARARDLAEAARLDLEQGLKAWEGLTGIYDLIRPRMQARLDAVIAWQQAHR
jgi:tetratricopeptide (TPR) repeat protein